MNSRNYILNLALGLLFITSFTHCEESYMPQFDQSKQPPTEIYTRDSTQICQSFINIVEYYRLAYQADSIDYVYPDRARFFTPYSRRLTLHDRIVASPKTTQSQIYVQVDTLLYNSDKRMCFALLIIRSEYSDIIGLEKSSKICPYDGMAVIGYRENIHNKFTLYPVMTIILSFRTYTICDDILKYYYFEQFEKFKGDDLTVFEGRYNVNLGDPDFFKKSPYFQKYDDSHYNFQMYQYNGEVYEYKYVEAATEISRNR